MVKYLVFGKDGAASYCASKRAPRRSNIEIIYIDVGWELTLTIPT